jgi:hypothetical protein
MEKTRENIIKLKQELKILKNELIQFFSDSDENINDEFYNKLIEYSSKNPEFLSVLKLLTVLSSKNDTQLKQYKNRTYKILEKFISMKDESLNILDYQHQIIIDLKKIIKEIQNNQKYSKFNQFLNILQIISKSKILTWSLTLSLVALIFLIVKTIDPQIYNDIINQLKNHTIILK